MNDEQQQNLLCDGSWEIIITATDLNITQRLRVKGDFHIGGVMLMLVDTIGIAKDWSDYALWWPLRNQWLLRTKNTLDQCGIHANTSLDFTPMHKSLYLQTPDLRVMTLRADFSIPIFSVVAHVCQNMDIRYPEELSLAKVYDRTYIKTGKRSSSHKLRNKGELLKNHTNLTDTSENEKHHYQVLDLEDCPDSKINPSLLTAAPYSTIRSLDNEKYLTSPNRKENQHTKRSSGGHYIACGTSNDIQAQNGKYSPHHVNMSPKIYLSDGGINTSKDDKMSNSSPLFIGKNKTNGLEDILIRPKSFTEKARMNIGWLNSSLSMMEQDIGDGELLMFRYKFFTFYDLNPKLDKVRINFIYNQANLSILFDINDCTDEEAILFAALQLQSQMQSHNTQLSEIDNGKGDFKEDVNDIDAALTDLQLSLESSDTINPFVEDNFLDPNNKFKEDPSFGLFASSLEIKDSLKLFKPKKFPLKSFKTYFCVFKDARIFIYENNVGYPSKPPLSVIELKGNEVIPDVNVNHFKYIIKLRVPQAKGITEYWLKCDNERQYAKWMAACRLAASQGTIHNAEIYQAEMQSILAFLSLQTPYSNNSTFYNNGSNNPNKETRINLTIDSIKAEDYLPKRILKRHKISQLTGRILEAHHNVSSLTPLEARMNYIKAWQALPEYGYTYFTVKFSGQKKEDLIAIAYNRIIKMDINSGAHLHTWRFTNMKNWSVNWEIKMVILEFENEGSSGQNALLPKDDDDGKVCFQCTCADCKVVHEFIGGYVFLAMRSKDDNAQCLDEYLFHKLTGGWA